MKVCPNCNYEVEDASEMCPKCGHSFVSDNLHSIAAKKSRARAVFGNVSFFISFPRILILFAVLEAICVGGVIFFDRQKVVYAARESLVTSCQIMFIAFIVLLAIVSIMLIWSLTLNIIRAKKTIKIKKKKK